MKAKSAMIEQLEGRRLLTTSYAYWGNYLFVDQALPGVTASWSNSGDTGNNSGVLVLDSPPVPAASHTLTLSGLPAHTMIRAADTGTFLSEAMFEGDSETLTITAGGNVQTVERFYKQNEQDFFNAGVRYSANFGRWFAHSGNTITITISASGFETNDHAFFGSFGLEIYNPTISMTGGGSSSENNPTPVEFALHRDRPSGYLGTPAGDEVIPDTDVEVTRGGTATAGADYSGHLPNGTVTFSNSAASKIFSITPIDDADGDQRNGDVSVPETITWAITPGQGIGPLSVTAEIADDSAWYYDSWVLEEGLGAVGSQEIRSSFLWAEGTDVYPEDADNPIKPWKEYARYVAVDSWRYIGVSDVSDNWGDPTDIDFELSNGTESNVSVAIGAPLPAGLEANVTIGASVSSGTSASEHYEASGVPRTQALLRGYVLHRSIVKYRRYEGGHNRNQSETSTVVLEGDLLGRYESARWRRERFWLDADSGQTAGKNPSETAAGDPPHLPNT